MNKHTLLTFLVLIGLLAMTNSSLASNANHADQNDGIEKLRHAVLRDLEGELFFKSPQADAWLNAKIGDRFNELDTVKTGANSIAVILVEGGSEAQLTLRPNTQIEIKKMHTNGDAEHTQMNLWMGSVLAKAEKITHDSTFQVKTPAMVAGIRGTEFEVSYQPPD
ncbi:MAG: ferric-dicitrate binding protein FerR (iron transport regulator) [Candidatus Omnitrophota bacterium]|jgi:ferric-dicitrate binding protein FerR (iron transport regulator)